MSAVHCKAARHCLWGETGHCPACLLCPVLSQQGQARHWHGTAGCSPSGTSMSQHCRGKRTPWRRTAHTTTRGWRSSRATMLCWSMSCRYTPRMQHDQQVAGVGAGLSSAQSVRSPCFIGLLHAAPPRCFVWHTMLQHGLQHVSVLGSFTKVRGAFLAGMAMTLGFLAVQNQLVLLGIFA